MPNWFDLLPDAFAKAQIAWEQRHAMLRANAAGASQKEIASKLGLHWKEVADAIHKAKLENNENKPSPLEFLVEDPRDTIKKYIRFKDLVQRQRQSVLYPFDAAPYPYRHYTSRVVIQGALST